MMRYEVVDISISGHCCFNATVVDPEDLDEKGRHKIICECFDIKDAEKIANALNKNEN